MLPLYKFLHEGKARSIEAKRNIILSVLIKGLGVIVSLLYVPILLNLFSPEKYGVWLTISSIITWFNFLDVGLANGFRNKFAEALAKDDHNRAREYVSTIYTVLPIISSIFFLVFCIVSIFLNWNSIYNTMSISNSILLNLTLVVVSSFSVKFCLQPIGQILLAKQKPAYYNALFLGGNILALMLIYFYSKFSTEINIIELAIIISYSPVVVFIVANYFLFIKYFKDFKPSIKLFSKNHVNSLMGIGLKFFFIQISMIVIMYSTNIMITQFSNPTDVARYNISQKLFSVGTMFFTIILTPMWSATTDAYYKEDYDWIKKTMRKFKVVAMFSTFIIIVLLIFSQNIVSIWLSDKLDIPFSIFLVEAFRTVVFMFFSPFASFLNGVSKIKLNMYLVVLQTIAYIPLAYFLGVYVGWGVVGIILSGILVEVPLRITQPIQYKLLMNRRATGIWNK